MSCAGPESRANCVWGFSPLGGRLITMRALDIFTTFAWVIFSPRPNDARRHHVDLKLGRKNSRWHHFAIRNAVGQKVAQNSARVGRGSKQKGIKLLRGRRHIGSSNLRVLNGWTIWRMQITTHYHKLCSPSYPSRLMSPRDTTVVPKRAPAFWEPMSWYLLPMVRNEPWKADRRLIIRRVLKTDLSINFKATYIWPKIQLLRTFFDITYGNICLYIIKSCIIFINIVRKSIILFSLERGSPCLQKYSYKSKVICGKDRRFQIQNLYIACPKII